MTDKDEFLKKLMETFRVEAEENLRSISTGLLEIEKNPPPEKKGKLLEGVYRNFHSLKGASRAVHLAEAESLCQGLENLFSALKSEFIQFNSEMFDLLHQSTDLLREITLSDEGKEKGGGKIASFLEKIGAFEKGIPAGEASIPNQEPLRKDREESAERIRPNERIPTAAGDTIRVPGKRIEDLFLQVEELFSLRFSLQERSGEISQIRSAATRMRAAWQKTLPSLRNLERTLERKSMEETPGSASHGETSKILDFMDFAYYQLRELETRLSEVKRSADHDEEFLALTGGALLEEAKHLLMIPFSTIVEMLPRIIRDLSRDKGKEAMIHISGEEIEMDRRILEGLRTPLLHLARNSMDHGIEKPGDRLLLGKPREGTLTVQVTRLQDNKVRLTISDDGAGIDMDQLIRISLKRGVISREEAERGGNGNFSLIFQSGTSSSALITDLSGRGLGLAIVKEKVEEMGGTVAVSSERSKGTTFVIELPVTLSAFRGIIVRIAEQEYIFPTFYIDRIVRLKKENLHTVENRDTFTLNGRTIPCVHTADLIRSNGRDVTNNEFPVLVAVHGHQVMGFTADDILQEQEILVKPLGKPFSRIPNIAGATVLGSGKIAPIFDIPELIRHVVKAAPEKEEKIISEVGDQEIRSILVVEDSITSRMLLKNILEAAGYRVHTAVDGLDAYTELKEKEIHLVVSDVDMPRMSGFELTTKIRSDRKLSELPVVLVTALESREDRERGIDVGADAYIVKSSFDQNNLLEVIEKLL